MNGALDTTKPQAPRSGYPVAVLGPFYPYRGGIAHHTTLLAKTLATAHPVLGISFKRLYPGLLFPGRTQLDPSTDPLQAEDVRIERVLDSIAPHTWVRASNTILRFGARLLVVQWWHPFFAPLLALVTRRVRRSGVRVVYLCHNVEPHETSFLDGALVRLGLGPADGFLVQARSDLDRLARRYPNRPRLHTPHPAYTFFASGRIDRETARAELGLEGPVVLFFGLVRAYKGLDVLLRAVREARNHIPLTLLVVGEFYQDRRGYDDLVHTLGLESAVRIHDEYVPNERVEIYFRAADVVCLPYVSATQSGIAQIASSFERPVIVSRVGGLPETVRPGETGTVVPPGDPAALATALVEFFTTDAISRMRPHLRHEVERFSWPALLGALHQLATRLGLPSP